MPLPLLLPVLGGLALVGLVAVAGGGRAKPTPKRAPTPRPTVGRDEWRVGVVWVGENEPDHPAVGHAEFSTSVYRDDELVVGSFRGGMRSAALVDHIEDNWQGGTVRFWLSTNTSGANTVHAQNAINQAAGQLRLTPPPVLLTGTATIQ